MARYYFNLRSLLLSALTVAAFSIILIGPSPTANIWSPYARVTTFERDFSFLADYAMPVSEQIKLAAALATESPPAKDPATLDGMLRSIDIRTALEDTRRLRFDLG